MTAWPRQGYLSKTMATYPSQSYSSKSRLLCQKLYVQGRATSPRLLVKAAVNGPLLKQRLLAQVKAGCQSKGYLSKSRLVVNDCFSKSSLLVHGWLSKLSKSWLLAQLVQVKATCPSQWPVVEQRLLVQVKAACKSKD